MTAHQTFHPHRSVKDAAVETFERAEALTASRPVTLVERDAWDARMSRNSIMKREWRGGEVSAKFTPGPWECVEATEHHGFYVVTDYGSTVCDLYAMSNPIAASVRNGGNSYPVPFIAEDCGANARLIAAAPDLLAALEKAADWFEKYAVEHYAKAKTAPGYGEQHSRETKGKTNRDRANELRAAISRATETEGE